MSNVVSAPHAHRRRLFRRYLFALVLLVSTVLVVSGAVQGYFSYEQNRTSLERIQQGQATVAADRIQQFITAIFPPIEAANQTLHNIGDPTPEQRTSEYQRLMREVAQISDLRYLDASGHELVQLHRLALNVPGSGADSSGAPAFVQAKGGKTYYGPVSFRNGSEPYMTIATPESFQGGGVTVVDVNLKFIWDVVNQVKVGKAGGAYVVDNRGQLIAHPDISLVLQNTDLSTLPQFRAALRASVAQPAASTGRDPHGRDVLSAYTTVTPPGWYVFADLPQSEAFAPLYASLERTGVLVIAGLVLAVLVSVVLARRMVTPIRALQAGAARIAGGALDQPIDVHTGDELEALADEFNRMTARLHQSYADLELKVEERTRELSLALSQVEAQRVALELASRHKSAFLAAMSHELRTPLNAVIGFSEVLLARMFGELNEQQADYMHDILTSGQHLLALINDILDLAKVEAGRMELVCTPFSLPDSLELSLSMVRERAARKALSVSLTVDPAVGLITADERKVTQVLVNLVTNAVKFTPEGGRIEITAGVEEDMAVIAVHDTGIGIAPDEQESIFEEFRQAGAPGEREGTGLGLGLSKQFVVLHGGRISVESAVGCGSTFTVHLPIQPVGMAGEGAAPAAEAKA